MKRKYNFYSLFALILLMMSACNKQLDLVPENNLVEEQVLADKATAERLLAGGFINQYSTERTILPMADQSTGIAYLVTNNFYTGVLDPYQSNIAGFWSTHYKAINIANVIINNLPREAKFDISIQKQYIAEAKFLRAYSYFRLALLFGYKVLGDNSDANPCVPLQLNPFASASVIIPRATNKQVLDRVVQDLEEAIPDLPSAYPDAANMDMKLRSRAVKAVGMAFLSRVYLYLNNFDKAIDNANLVLANNNYVLAASPANVFPDNKLVIAGAANISFNKEVVYGYPVSFGISTTNLAYVVDPSFIQTYTPNDIRGSMVIKNAQNQNTTSKYSSPAFYDNIMVIRLSEVMLNKAEALARRDGLNQTSIDILNAIYQRAFVVGQKPAFYTMASFADKNALVSRILLERRWELAYEGHDRFDKIRAGLPINPVLPLNRYALPIPQADVDITSGVLAQNLGY
ncbi:SusD family protein [Pedobacter sp. ok626]|uniref:RagB/SusD family nutrient uptake outer membrane protein n=1 Tax=Pedobacter sp. ok626 TaxID=1761882 RepID=UPI0008843711|nr:RagB/SusD family nutrient uptake outer membrane protein [Pedobacter sp. ok626]SDK65736.1 SusD family protein [Pedobacter sp. ok626]